MHSLLEPRVHGRRSAPASRKETAVRRTIGLIALVALAGLAACGGSTSPDPSSPFPVPVHLQPSNGVVFNNFQRDTTLVWSPVARAASYWVEVEYCQPPQCTEGSTV